MKITPELESAIEQINRAADMWFTKTKLKALWLVLKVVRDCTGKECELIGKGKDEGTGSRGTVGFKCP